MSTKLNIIEKVTRIIVGGMPFFLKEHDALLLLEHHITGQRRLIWGRNIVTTAGNVWYAQLSCAQAPTNAFANVYHATAGPGTPGVSDNYGSFTVIAGSSTAKTAGYPQVPDADADNTGDGATIVSWKFAHAIADGPFTSVTHSFIAKTGAGGTDPILNSLKWGAPWTKDTSTSAKVFFNHTLLGQ